MTKLNGEKMQIGGASELSEFVTDANSALRFHLVREPDDIHGEQEQNPQKEEDEDEENKMVFNPEMTHQIYGDQENIFGYRDLQIDMLMSAGSLKAYISTKYSKTVSEADTDGVAPDPLIPPIVKLLGQDQMANSLNEFKEVVSGKEEKEFKPMGDKLHEWTFLEQDSNLDRHFEIYHCLVSTPGFKAYNSRLQPWMMFFIDAASYVDMDDENWNYFLLFEKFTDSSKQPRYAIVGFISVYQYYAYPCHLRPRVSQMLILPPFQRMGIGAKLLDNVQRFYWKNDKIIDITVEDPSEDFVRLRDFVDCTNCMKLASFQESSLKEGFSDAMVKEANKAYKLCKRQVRRVYEILRFRVTKREDKEEYKAYRVDVKNRLNLPYLKQEKQMAKLQKVLKPEELAAAMMNLTNKEQQLEMLQNQYMELEEHYIKITERIAAV